MSVHMSLLEHLRKGRYAKEKSPCISDCTLVNKSTHMICKGCGRTQEEISKWGMLSKIEIDKLRTLNVNGIITDFPDRF